MSIVYSVFPSINLSPGVKKLKLVKFPLNLVVPIAVETVPTVWKF